MFEKLVESGSHKQEFKRRGISLGVTSAAMILVLFGMFLWSIIYFNAHIDAQNLEMVTLIAPVPLPTSKPPKVDKEPPKKQKIDVSKNVDVRKDKIANVDEVKLIPKEVGAKASDVPPVRRGVETVIGSENKDAITPMIPNSGTGIGGPPSVVKVEDAPPPPPKPTPKPTPRAPVSGGVMNGKAKHLTQPSYPAIARSARASGQVVVQILIDENGNVVEANAISGHPLLRGAAVNAARSSKFTPTLLSGVPVKVSGQIIYNFLPQ